MKTSQKSFIVDKKTSTITIRRKIFVFVMFSLAFLMFFSPILASASSWTSNLNNGLVAYWKFDDTTTSGTITVDSVGRFDVNGTLLGGVTTGATNCKQGQCYQFDGSNDAINFTTDSHLISRYNFTANIWVNTSGNVFGQGVWGRYHSTERTWIMWHGLGNSARGTLIEAMFNKNTDYQYGYILDSVADNGKWHMWTFVHNDSAGTLFVDGAYVTSLGDTNGMGTAGSVMTSIGYINWNPTDTVPFSGLIDEASIYNRSLNSSEISDLYNSGSGITYPATAATLDVTLISPNNGFSTYATSINFFTNITPGLATYNVSNATLYIWKASDSSIYATNYTKLAGSFNQTNRSYSNIANGNYLWNTWACSNNTAGAELCNWATANYSFTVGRFIENSQTYNSYTLSSAYETFRINVTYNPSLYSGLSVSMRYNGTTKTATTSDAGSNRLYSSSFTVPSTTAVMNTSFFWVIALTNSTGTFYSNSSFRNQTIGLMGLDNCTINNATIMNLFMKDQETLDPINGTIEILANIYSLGTTTLIGTYNASLPYVYGATTRVCMSNLTASYSMSYQLRYYGNATYYTQYKNIQSMTLDISTAPQNVTLYDLKTTSGYPFIISIRGTTDNSGVLVDAQRQYIYLNNYISVESPVTASSGDAVLHLTESTAVYNFIVSRNGVVLGTFNSYQVKCDNVVTGQCYFTLNVAQSTIPLPNFNNLGNISKITLWDNSSRELTMTFSSTDGLSHVVRVQVLEASGWQNTTICDQTITSDSGTITCPIPTSVDGIVIQNVYSDGNKVEAKTLSLQNPSGAFAGTRTILMLFLYCSLVLLFIANPAAIVVGGMIGVGLSIVIMTVDGGYTSGFVGVSVLIYFLLAGGLIAWQIGRRI